MPTRHYLVATAGHVDHGKSALVHALTGLDPDRLPEEKARGITIDLGFAPLVLPWLSAGSDGRPTRPDSVLRLGLIDVPGHEDFVKNMVAGVGSVDAALLVVAADDGWMPQTEEHLQILAYLGVRTAVVALTKADRMPGREQTVQAQVREKLQRSPFAKAPIVPTSIRTGAGLAELRSTLARILSDLPEPRDAGKPRVPIDRAFKLRGLGTIVTGSLSGGRLHRDQLVVLQPSGLVTRLRSLQNHGEPAEELPPSTRAALQLADGLDAVLHDRARGQVITIPELGPGTRTFDAVLEFSPRRSNPGPSPGPWKPGTPLRLHHGTACVTARVSWLDPAPPKPGNSALAQVRTEQPLFVLGGERFLLRDSSQRHTLAGGLILDADASRRHLADPSRRALLLARSRSPEDVGVWAESQLRQDRARRRAGFLRRTLFGEREIDEALNARGARGEVVNLEGWLLERSCLEAWQSKIADQVREFHQAHPAEPGLPLTTLRRQMIPETPGPEVLDLILSRLITGAYRISGATLRQETHCPALPPPWQAAGTQLRSALTRDPFEPPTKKELIKTPGAPEALRFLVETGEAIEVGPELVMSRESLWCARNAIRFYLSQKGTGTASELRQVLGTSRRVIIPLLEWLDREGTTVRQGDQRTLREVGRKAGDDGR